MPPKHRRHVPRLEVGRSVANSPTLGKIEDVHVAVDEDGAGFATRSLADGVA
jgi:hypothetical protein